MYYRLTLVEKLARFYPFKREVISKVFRNLLKKLDFILPKHIMLKKVDRSEDLNYHPYHHRVGYPIKDYITFKKWLEHYCQYGAIVLPKDYLVNSFDSIMVIFGEIIDPLPDDHGW